MEMSVGLVGDVELLSEGMGCCREVSFQAEHRETPAWEVRPRVWEVELSPCGPLLGRLEIWCVWRMGSYWCQRGLLCCRNRGSIVL